MTDFYHITLLRHGESVGNASGIFQGQTDMALNDTGRLQARLLAAVWKDCHVTFNRIVSSPLLRARETSEIISAQLKVGIDFDPDLMERNGGQRQGMTMEEADVQFPHPGFVHPYLRMGTTGESEWEFFLRAGRAIQNLIHRPPGRYLVVAHGGILNRLMYAILGIMPQPNFTGPRFRFENTAYAVLTYQPGGHNWTVLKINERSHWNGVEAEDGILAGIEPLKSGEAGDEEDRAASRDR